MTSTTRPARPHRARRGEGERLREELLTTAESLLVEKGSMDKVSMRAIAERIGVTPPSIYLHFEDKEELFFEVCQARFLRFADAFLNAADHLDDPADQLRTIGLAYIDWGLAHPEHYDVLFGSGIRVPDSVDIVRSPGRLGLQKVIDTVQRGIDEGIFAPTDAVRASLGLWSTVHGFVHLATNKADFVPDIDLRGAREQVVELAVRGLLA